MECFKRCVQGCLNVLQGSKKESSAYPPEHTIQMTDLQPQESKVPLETAISFPQQSKAYRSHLPMSATASEGLSLEHDKVDQRQLAEPMRRKKPLKALTVDLPVYKSSSSQDIRLADTKYRAYLGSTPTLAVCRSSSSQDIRLGDTRCRTHLPRSATVSGSLSGKKEREEVNQFLRVGFQPTEPMRRKKHLKETLLSPLSRMSHSHEMLTLNDPHTVKYRPDLFALTETLHQSDPSLEFSIDHDFHKCILRVYLRKACNLPARKTSAMNTFVTMFLLPDRDEVFESQVVEKSLNPIFNQTFELRGILTPEEAREKVLVFRIYDNDVIWKDKLIGMVYFPLKLVQFDSICVRRKIDLHTELQKVMTRGDVLLSLRYDPRSKSLSGILHKATNLYNHHVFTSTNPYAKVDLMHRGEKVARWKSQIHKRTLFPVFNETFQFNLGEFKVENVMLRLAIVDLKKFRWKETIGVARVGPSVSERAGKLHWSEMLASVGEIVSRWHPLSPPGKKRQRHQSM